MILFLQVISNLKKATLGDHGSTPPLSTKTTPKHKKKLIVTPLNRESLDVTSQNGQKSPIHSPRTTPSPQPTLSYTSSSPVESTSIFFVQGTKEGVNKGNEETKLKMYVCVCVCVCTLYECMYVVTMYVHM